MNEFVIYSRDGCPYCVKVKAVLEGLKLNHSIRQLGVDFSREEFYNQFGQGSTFPQVVFGEIRVGGCSETIKYLKENNYV